MQKQRFKGITIIRLKQLPTQIAKRCRVLFERYGALTFETSEKHAKTKLITQQRLQTQERPEGKTFERRHVNVLENIGKTCKE